MGAARSFGAQRSAGRGSGNRSARGRAPGGEPTGDPEQPPGDPEAVARIVCLRLLDQRPRTRAELAEALARRGVPDEPAIAVLDRFTDVGLIDDAALADAMAGAQHRDRGLARRAVAGKLRRRGVGDEHIAAALTQIDPDSERVRARELAQRRQRSLAALPVAVQQRRLVGLLGRKGYPAGLAFDVARAVLREAAVADLLTADEECETDTDRDW